MPPDLYPELIGSSSFVLSGFARCLDIGQEAAPQPSSVGRVAAGFFHFGPNCFHVRQVGNSPEPSFGFLPLTMKFVTGAIGYDPEFEFSLTQKNLGKVTYKEATRDDTRSIYQAIHSVIGSGSWNSAGLHFSLKGELDDTPPPYLPGPASKEYRWDKYEIAVHIPWEVLKYMFFEQVHFVLGNYKKHA